MLKVNHLSKSYQTGAAVYPVLKDISFEIKKGEFVQLTGPSEAAKLHCSIVSPVLSPTTAAKYC